MQIGMNLAACNITGGKVLFLIGKFQMFSMLFDQKYLTVKSEKSMLLKHSTAQHSTAQHSTAQHSTARS